MYYSERTASKNNILAHFTAGAVMVLSFSSLSGLRIFQQFGGIAKHVAFSTCAMGQVCGRNIMVMIVVVVVFGWFMLLSGVANTSFTPQNW